jgi:hypothetical protein
MPVDELVNNIKLPTMDEDHLFSLFQDSPDGILAPFGNGLVVVDLDHNVIISYQNTFIVGAIKNGNESDILQAFYDEGRIMADDIDYMLDLSPLVPDNYDPLSTTDGMLVRSKLIQLGFAFTNQDNVFWEVWFKNTSK